MNAMKNILKVAGVLIALILIIVAQKDSGDLEDVSYSKSSKNSESEIVLSDSVKVVQSDMEMYLTNSSEAIPVKVENVYQESTYAGTRIAFDMVNASGDDIKEVAFGVVAWDSNMLPLELNTVYDYESTYFYTCQSSNIAEGQTQQGSLEFTQQDIKYMQILLLEYSDFDGNIWTSPATTYYEENYAGKKLDENTMNVMVFSTDNLDNIDDMSGDIES